MVQACSSSARSNVRPEPLEVPLQIEPTDSADARGIFIEWQRAAVRLIQLGPRAKPRAFRVDDQPVEIEYQSSDASS